jgi:hypothetical protein
MIKNWRDLVGYEEITAPIGKVHYMKMTSDSDNSVMMQIMKYEVECTLTEEELCDELDRILTSFSNTCENNSVAIERAKLDSVRKMKRGIPNTKYENAQYYKGTTSYDSPVVVGGFEGKFGIYVHPNFNDYGFVIQ